MKPQRQRINGGGKAFSIMSRQSTVSQAIPREWLDSPTVERTEFKTGKVVYVTVAQADYELQNNWYPVRGDIRSTQIILAEILASGVPLCSLQASYVAAQNVSQAVN